ncbi:MAG TPA: amidohydrolase, partial [Burkholderiaceae bacterium]|nr:amidohydrolase [Burkholderiaceae bacterium]
MGAIEELGRYLPQMTEWRRHLHANPETAFEEVGTARFVAERLRAFGVDEVHEGIARTGVVGVIRGGPGTGAI